MRHIDIDDIVTDNEAFMTEVLATLQDANSLLAWRAVDGRIQFYLRMHHVEDAYITPENLPQLQQAIADVQATGTKHPVAYWGPYLFAIRQRSNAGPRYTPDELRPLFAEAWREAP